MKGWTVLIIRDDNTSFLASGTGDCPPVWVQKNRKWAVQYKQELIAAGFVAKVVPVEYTKPVIRVKGEPT